MSVSSPAIVDRRPAVEHTVAHVTAASRRHRSTSRIEGALVAGFDLLAMIAVVLVVRPDAWLAATCLALVLVRGCLDGLYRRPRLALRPLSEMRCTLHAAAGPLAVAGVAAVFEAATLTTVRFTAALVPAVACSRIPCFAVVRLARRRRLLSRRILLVGTGEVADRLRRTFAHHPELGVDLVGTIDDRRSPIGRAGGGVRAVADAVRRTRADTVVVAFSRVRDSDLTTELRTLRDQRVEVFVVPRLFNFGTAAGDTRTQSCGGIPLVWLPHREWRREHLAIKRAADLVIASVALVILSPLLLLAAVAVRCSSPGPVLFRQVRLGRDAKPFVMYKFRSMRVGGEPDTHQSGADSPLVTGVGKILRRLSIDELPQLLNVVKGDMAIVGPRPEQPQFVERCQAIPGYGDRHRVPVGITGWAQVNKLRGARTSLEDRAAHDNYYIDHWSIWLDLEIILRTATEALRGS